MRSFMTVLILFLVGCGSSPATQAPADSPPTEPAPVAEPAVDESPAGLIIKAPADMVQADFSGAFKELGYELKSFSVSGAFTTVLAMQGDERCTVVMLTAEPPRLDEESKRIAGEKGAAKITNGTMIGVRLDPPNHEKSAELLLKLFGE